LKASIPAGLKRPFEIAVLLCSIAYVLGMAGFMLYYFADVRFFQSFVYISVILGVLSISGFWIYVVIKRLGKNSRAGDRKD